MTDEHAPLPEEDRPGPAAHYQHDVGPGNLRIILWLILLYALGFALMVVEDVLSHIFI